MQKRSLVKVLGCGFVATVFIVSPFLIKQEIKKVPSFAKKFQLKGKEITYEQYLKIKEGMAGLSDAGKGKST